MPAGKKQCLNCHKEWGTRKKVCDCGYEFIGHPLAPEPGAWVLDNVKGMPVMSPPPDLPESKISTEELRDCHVAYEGLGFCIYDYIPAEKIEDPKLQALWKIARRAMQDVVVFMENK